MIKTFTQPDFCFPCASSPDKQIVSKFYLDFMVIIGCKKIKHAKIIKKQSFLLATHQY